MFTFEVLELCVYLQAKRKVIIDGERSFLQIHRTVLLTIVFVTLIIRCKIRSVLSKGM